MKPPRLVRKEFKSWLENKKPRQVVGRRFRCGLCPIAQFLAEHHKISRPWASSTYGSATSFADQKTSPFWTMSFMSAADKSGEENTRITAATALRILEQIR